MTDHSAERDGRPGAWLVYDYDHGPYAIELHATAEGAARQAARRGYGRVGYWSFGDDLRTAVHAWEGRTPPGDRAEESK